MALTLAAHNALIPKLSTRWRWHALRQTHKFQNWLLDGESFASATEYRALSIDGAGIQIMRSSASATEYKALSIDGTGIQIMRVVSAKDSK
jgi:hypothetical protein